MGCAPDVGVGRVRLLGGVAVREAAGDEPLAHLLASTELVDELGIEPRLVDAQARVGHEAVAVEPLDIVSLVGGSVTPDVDAVFLHRAHEHRARDHPAEGRGVEVGLARGANVERATLQRDETLLNEGRLRVHQAGPLGAILQRPSGNRVDVGLVILADVGGVGERDRALLPHPGDRARGVETPGERYSDFFADGEGAENLRHRPSLEGHCAHAGRQGCQLECDLLRSGSTGTIAAGERAIDGERLAHSRG